MDVKRTFRRVAFLVSRLLGNMGVGSATPLLARFALPIHPERDEPRWLNGRYLNVCPRNGVIRAPLLPVVTALNFGPDRSPASISKASRVLTG